MKHLMLYEDFICDETELELNEYGLKSVAVGTMLFLTSFLPSNLLANDIIQTHDNEIKTEIPVVKVNKSVSKKDVAKIIKKMMRSKAKFDVQPGTLPIEMQLEKIADDTKFVIINTAGQTYTAADFMMNSLIRQESNKIPRKRPIKLFSQVGEVVQCVAIVQVN
jgi:hypothetical protein